MSVLIKFYNIPESSNSVELGPYAGIVCDGDEVTAIHEDETEKAIAVFVDDSALWHVPGDYPAYYAYFEVYGK